MTFFALYFCRDVARFGRGIQMRAWSMQLASERNARKEVEDSEMADYWAYLERVSDANSHALGHVSWA